MATHAERLAELNNDPDVLEAILADSFAPISGTTALYQAHYRYVWTDGDIARDSTIRVIAYDFGGAGEAVYWAGRKPDVLTNDPPEYFADRTASTITAAQIESYCNGKWATVQTSPDDIRNFSVSVVNGDTIRVSGLFHITTSSTWEQRSYFVHLVDPDGAVTAGSANVKFERITDGVV